MKKMLSSALALLLSLLIVFFITVPGISAANKSCLCGNEPIVMISGFGATTLVDENGEVAFPFNSSLLVKAVKDSLPSFKKEDPYIFIANTVQRLVEPIAMDENGNSVHKLRPIYASAEDTSLEGFIKNDAEKYIPYTGSEFLDMKSVGERVGDDHVFNFLYDWRLSGDVIADKLQSYIKEVMDITGHKKVSIYCLSQGSVATAQYLYKYADCGYIDNLVFDNPIFMGSDFVSDLFNGEDGEFGFDFENIMKLLSNILHTEIDLSCVAGLIPDGANKIAKQGAEKVILPVVKNSPAYLEMIPADKYDSVCKNYFSSSGNEKIIEQAENVRGGYMKDVELTLRNAIANGADISVISCSGNALVTGSDIQSDGIVDLSSSCGAYCAPYGKTFSEDYIQQKDIGKNCISPGRDIDLSCAFLPEKTWVINELYHGQAEWAKNSLNLIETLLYTHKIKNAWSSFEFPQFMQSNDPNLDFYAYFEETGCLYAPMNGSGRMIIKNTSDKNTMLVKSISSSLEYGFNKKMPLILKPGEKMILNFDTSKNAFSDISIKYCESDNPTCEKSKTFSFSVCDNYSGIISNKRTVETNITIPNQIKAVLWLFANTALKIISEIIKDVII